MIHVCPYWFHEQVPVDKNSPKIEIYNASGECVKHYGQRKVHLVTEGGQELTITFEVADVVTAGTHVARLAVAPVGVPAELAARVGGAGRGAARVRVVTARLHSVLQRCAQLGVRHVPNADILKINKKYYLKTDRPSKRDKNKYLTNLMRWSLSNN